MRILLFIGSLETGGSERQFSMLAEGLAGRGHDVTLCTLRPGGRYWDWLRGRGTVRVLSLHESRSARQLITSARRLRVILEGGQYDVCYSALELTNLFARLAIRGGCKTRLAWGFRTSDAAVSWKSRWPLTLCRRLSAAVPLAIANSHAGEAHHRRIGFQCRRWEVIPNGVDTDYFRPDDALRRSTRNAWNLTHEHIAIGIVARLSPIKDHRTLLRAAAMTAPSDNVRFIIVGGGPDAYRHELQSLALASGISKRLLWTGEVGDVRGAYNALDIVVLTSSSGEGTPNSILEAMACGRYCVATDVGDVRRVVGDCGQVVPPGAAELLATSLTDAIDKLPTHEAAMARQRVESEYGLSAMVERSEEALSGLMATFDEK